MICDKCKEPISASAPIYKASRGFLSEDGGFFEDLYTSMIQGFDVVFHSECHHSYNPFEHIEAKLLDY